MSTTINDLIERLEAIRDEIAATLGSETAAGDAEVRLAIQPRWAMQHAIADRELAWHVDGDSGEVVAYLAEAGQALGAPYLPGNVAEALGWS